MSVTTTAAYSTSHKLGDLVIIHPDCDPADTHKGRIFRITTAPKTSRQVNYIAEPIEGGRGVKGKADVFAPADGEQETAAAEIKPTEPVYLGTVVKLRGKGDANFVVIGEQGGKYRVAKLGGEGGRYFTGIARAALTVVDPTAL